MSAFRWVYFSKRFSRLQGIVEVSGLDRIEPGNREAGTGNREQQKHQQKQMQQSRSKALRLASGGNRKNTGTGNSKGNCNSKVQGGGSRAWAGGHDSSIRQFEEFGKKKVTIATSVPW